MSATFFIIVGSGDQGTEPLYATGLFLYLLKTSDNQRFSNVFRGYRKRPMVKNRLTKVPFVLLYYVHAYLHPWKHRKWKRFLRGMLWRSLRFNIKKYWIFYIFVVRKDTCIYNFCYENQKFQAYNEEFSLLIQNITL